MVYVIRLHILVSRAGSCKLHSGVLHQDAQAVSLTNIRLRHKYMLVTKHPTSYETQK
jgi:hypothetical protein